MLGEKAQEQRNCTRPFFSFFPVEINQRKRLGKSCPQTRKRKKARIIYELDKKQWEGEIDLIGEKVKKVKFLGKPQE